MRGKLVKKSKGLPGKNQKATSNFILIDGMDKYTNLYAIELSIMSRLHRDNILNT